jgi:hypothetical protein
MKGNVNNNNNHMLYSLKRNSNNLIERSSITSVKKKFSVIDNPNNINNENGININIHDKIFKNPITNKTNSKSLLEKILIKFRKNIFLIIAIIFIIYMYFIYIFVSNYLYIIFVVICSSTAL